MSGSINDAETNAAYFAGTSAPFTLGSGEITLISGFTADEPLRLEDADGDGLSLSYEMLLGTSDSRSDSDGDGMLDGDEYTAGTDAADHSSVMKIAEMIPAGETLTLQLQTVAGKQYNLIYHEDLEDEGQVAAGAILAAGSLTEVTIDLPDSSRGFFTFELAE